LSWSVTKITLRC